VTFSELLRDGRAALRACRWADGEELLRQAGAIAADEAERALAAMHMAGIPLLQNRPDADLNVFRENLVRRHSPQHVLVAAYYLVMASVDRNDRAGAERYLPTLLDAATASTDTSARMRAWDLVAGVESIRGNHVAAIEYGRAALAELETYDGDDGADLRVAFTHNLAYNCLAANLLAEAVEYADASIPLAEELGNPRDLRQALVTGAMAHLCRNDLERAGALADRADGVAGEPSLEKYVHYVRGEIARRRGDVAEATRHFRRLEPFYPNMPTIAEVLLSMNVAPFLLPE